MDLTTELQKIYDSEINVSISWLWDGGIDVRLGDEVNGFLVDRGTVAGIVPWLKKATAHFYPNSFYAAYFSPEVRACGQTSLAAPENRFLLNLPTIPAHPIPAVVEAWSAATISRSPITFGPN